MQAQSSDSCQERIEGQVAAPLEAAWDSIRTGLRRDLGARTFDGWLKPAALGSFNPDSGALDLVMPSQFMADWVRSHFGDRLALAWKSTLPLVREIRIVANTDGPKPTPLLILDETPEPAARGRDPSAPNSDPRYRFETFVIGKANEVAATAARTLAAALEPFAGQVYFSPECHERYVALGLARVRTPWFSDVARWANSGALPVDFLMVLSMEELSARLRVAGVHLQGNLHGSGLDRVDAGVSVRIGAAPVRRAPRHGTGSPARRHGSPARSCRRRARRQNKRISESGATSVRPMSARAISTA